MDHLLFGSFLSFLVTFSAIPIIIRVAEMKHLFDVPDNRKIHASPVPSLGGIGIFAGFIMAFLITAPSNFAEIQYMSAAFLVIFFVGMKDDIIVLTPFKKFLGQILAALIVIYKGGVIISSMYGFMGMTNMPSFMSVAFTFLTIIVITNSFNLIDGVDGLAGSLGLFTTLAFGLYFLLAGQLFYSVLAFSMMGALAAFLIYNISPAKIFMGDTGSLLLGFVNSILVIKFIQVASTPASTIYLPAAPAIGFAILFVPLFDTLRIFSYRILSRRSPFSPDRNHVHHLLLDLGYSHNMVTFFAVAFNILVVAAVIVGRNLNITFLLIGLISLGFTVIIILIYSNRVNRKKFFGMAFEKEPKVISIKKPTVQVLSEAEEIAK